MLFVYQLALREQKEEDCGNVDAREQDPRPNALALLFAPRQVLGGNACRRTVCLAWTRTSAMEHLRPHGIRFGDTTHGS